MDLFEDQQLSDDEVFVGELTLKELKISLGLGYDRRSVRSAHKTNEEINRSVKIIEAHSTPNILSSCDNTIETNRPVSTSNLLLDFVNGDCDMRPDDSFLALEKLVSNMEVTPGKNDIKDSLNNTEEVVDYIPSNSQTANCNPNQELPIINVEEYHTPENFKHMRNKPKPISSETPYAPCSSSYSTPAKNIYNVQGLNLDTALTDLQETPVFKTPGNPVSHKKKPGSHIKKTFDHVISPVASYIKNSPSVPLLKEVRPRKPLPVSCIPKPVKSATKPKTSNKENTKLPSVAYKNAKETKMIDIPDKGKLPKSQWAKQVASSIPRALVIKHDHREISGVKKLFSLSQAQEDSFDDLSSHQADVSVCTQQSAVKVRKVLK